MSRSNLSHSRLAVLEQRLARADILLLRDSRSTEGQPFAQVESVAEIRRRDLIIISQAEDLEARALLLEELFPNSSSAEFTLSEDPADRP